MLLGWFLHSDRPSENLFLRPTARILGRLNINCTSFRRRSDQGRDGYRWIEASDLAARRVSGQSHVEESDVDRPGMSGIFGTGPGPRSDASGSGDPRGIGCGSWLGRASRVPTDRCC